MRELNRNKYEGDKIKAQAKNIGEKDNSYNLKEGERKCKDTGNRSKVGSKRRSFERKKTEGF